VGGFLVTNEDELTFAKRRTSMDIVSKPDPDDKLYPELWRVPGGARKQKSPKFKTVCRIVGINTDACLLMNARLQAVSPSAVQFKVELFVRPVDIGVVPKCPFEVIETNRSEYHCSMMQCTYYVFFIIYPHLGKGYRD
jgi:hypothetical protein